MQYFKTGGKQYLAQVGETVRIEKIKGDLKKGDAVSFDKVLLVSNDGSVTIGTPTVPGAHVSGDIKTISRAQKVTVIKYKQKSRYFKKNGHRQPYMDVTITAIK